MKISIRSKKILCGILLLAVALSAIFIFFKLKYSRPTLTIGVYTDSSWEVPNGDADYVTKLAIKKFKKKYPNVQIKYEAGIRKNDYNNWLTEKIVKGTTPDVIMLPEDIFNLLASNGTLKSLNSSITDDRLSPSTFYRGALKAGQYHNIQYGLPYETNPTLMIANNDLLAKNGFSNLKRHLSPRKLKNICHTISLNKDYAGITSDYTWQDAQLAYGNSVFENSAINLTSNKARLGFSLIEDLTNENGYQSVNSNQFDQGRVAFMPLSLAKYRTYTSYPYHVAHTSNFKWKVFQMPSIINVQATPAATVCLGISAKTDHPTLSWKFIKLMCTDEEIQQEVIKNRMGSSVLPKVINSTYTKKIFQKEQQNTLTTQELDSILKNVAITPKFRNYDRRSDELNYLIQNALKNNQLNLQLFNIQHQINKNEY